MWYAAPVCARALLLGFGLVGALACDPRATLPRSPETPEAAVARAAAEFGDVMVLYPVGDCATGVIEVQVYQREGSAPGWHAHTEHPRVRAGSIQHEDPSKLLNELRVRCVDPEGVRPPSVWVVGARYRD